MKTDGNGSRQLEFLLLFIIVRLGGKQFKQTEHDFNGNWERKRLVDCALKSDPRVNHPFVETDTFTIVTTQ